jgi:hypothetical protein
MNGALLNAWILFSESLQHTVVWWDGHFKRRQWNVTPQIYSISRVGTKFFSKNFGDLTCLHYEKMMSFLPSETNTHALVMNKRESNIKQTACLRGKLTRDVQHRMSGVSASLHLAEYDITYLGIRPRGELHWTRHINVQISYNANNSFTIYTTTSFSRTLTYEWSWGEAGKSCITSVNNYNTSWLISVCNFN